ncbi:MAG: oligosaccharide flippase family protein [Spirochaetales bacterium]|nr:oligosaccharide flippase family protein [Spirochaetales bacterium]
MKKRSIRFNISVSLALKVVNLLLSFGLSILYARVLGKAEYGVYTFILSMIGMADVSESLGLTALITRETAVGIHSETAQIKGFLIRTFQAFLVVSFSTSIVLGIIAFIQPNPDYHLPIIIIIIAFSTIPCTAFLKFNSSVLRGLHRIIESQLPEQIIRPLFIGLSLLALQLFISPGNVTAFHSLILVALNGIIAILFTLTLLTRSLPKDFFKVKPIYENKKILKDAWPYTLSSFLGSVIHNIDFIILGILTDNGTLGVFKIIVVGSRFISLVMYAINTVLGPSVAKLHAENKTAKLQRMISKNLVFGFFLTLPILLFNIIFGKFFLATVYGAEYTVGYYSLIIISLGQFFDAVTGPSGMILKMTKHQIHNLIANIIGAAIMITGCAAFIPLFGMEGGALAISLTLCAKSIYMIIIVKIKTGILTLPFGDLIK